MPRFKFVAVDAKRVETEGVIDADSQSHAISLIRSRGLFPTRVTVLDTAAQRAAASAAPAAKGRKGLLKLEFKMPRLFGGRVKAKQLTVFTRQLATLVDAGMPLLRGLNILLKQEKNTALREAISGMGEAVEGGSTFSEALATYPRIFDRLFVNMVKAGEAGGVMEKVLNRIAEFMEKAERIKGRVKSAMIYPVVVLLATVGILSFLLISVIPKFEQIFKDLLEGQELPLLTRIVIGISNVVKDQAILVVVGVVLFVVLLRLWIRTKTGRYLVDKLKLKIPLFGPLFTRSSVGRVTRTLGTLMGAGVPVLQALNIVRDTSGNDVIARAIQLVHDSVKEGETMAAPLGASGVFPGMVVSMVDVGEETGALPEMLVRVADVYDEEVDRAVEGLTSVIEPILIIIMAVVIGTIVIAMFVPLIKIITTLGNQ